MRALRSLILTGMATAALVAGTGAAMADPPAADNPPPTTSIVASGSDTIQYLADDNSTGYDAGSPTNPYYSWDAVNPTTGLPGDTIKTKNDANCSMTRPNGSSGGISQLGLETKTADNHLCVDLARSSRPIASGDGPVVSFLFAKDLITWSATSTGNGSAVKSLTGAELTAIYECNANALPTGDTQHAGAVKWSDLKLENGTSGDAIIPILPQTSSGTRAQFLSDIGVTATTLGGCVVNGTFNSTPIEENEGTNAVFTTDAADALFPFSAGSWNCQVNHTTFCTTNSTGKLVLKNISGIMPLSGTTLNTGSFPATFVRSLFYVALNAGSDGLNGDPAPAIPNGTNGTSENIDLVPFLDFLCTSTGLTETTDYGFADPPTGQCGALKGNPGPAK